MTGLWQRVGRALLRAVRRFFANAPANPYEAAAFGAVRNMAMTFGKAVA